MSAAPQEPIEKIALPSGSRVARMWPFKVGQVLPIEEGATLSGIGGLPTARLFRSQCFHGGAVSTRDESSHA
jgi:hypothetical protein